MLEGGSIRFIQQFPGLEKLEATAIYTVVTNRQLQLTRLAVAGNSSMGAVISDLVRRGLSHTSLESRQGRSAFLTFSVPADAKPLSLTLVKSLIDEAVG